MDESSFLFPVSRTSTGLTSIIMWCPNEGCTNTNIDPCRDVRNVDEFIKMFSSFLNNPVFGINTVENKDKTKIFLFTLKMKVTVVRCKIIQQITR